MKAFDGHPATSRSFCCAAAAAPDLQHRPDWCSDSLSSQRAASLATYRFPLFGVSEVLGRIPSAGCWDAPSLSDRPLAAPPPPPLPVAASLKPLVTAGGSRPLAGFILQNVVAVRLFRMKLFHKNVISEEGFLRGS